MFDALVIDDKFVAWDILTGLECVVFAIKPISSDAVGEFMKLGRWIFLVLVDSVPNDSVTNIYLWRLRLHTFVGFLGLTSDLVFAA